MSFSPKKPSQMPKKKYIVNLTDEEQTKLDEWELLADVSQAQAAIALRPIITTSVTTIIGLILLELSDPTWKPLCSVIILGLLVATVIALFVVPALYLLLSSKTKNIN